ncbi:MAG: metallophosphoesterase [Thermoprotei archaeon]|nr:MAG: metallophosphoesterase [Thermoprotei archaeon]
MLVGVLSDTHDNLNNVEKAINLLKRKKITTVIHAGDIIAPFTLRKFLNTGLKFYGVFGNNDGEIFLLSKIALSTGLNLKPQPYELELDGRKIIIFHGMGGMEETKRVAYALVRYGNYDIVIFGHTHEVMVEKVEDKLLLNPGEVFGGLTGKATLAILDLETLEVEIIEL